MSFTRNPFGRDPIDPAIATRLGTAEQQTQVVEIWRDIRTGTLPEHVILGWGSPPKSIYELQETRLKLPADSWYELIQYKHVLDNILEPSYSARLAAFFYGKTESGNDLDLASHIPLTEVTPGEQRILNFLQGSALYIGDPLSMFVLEPLPRIILPPGGEVGFNVRSTNFLASYTQVYNLWMVFRKCGVSRRG